MRLVLSFSTGTRTLFYLKETSNSFSFQSLKHQHGHMLQLGNICQKTQTFAFSVAVARDI